MADQTIGRERVEVVLVADADLSEEQIGLLRDDLGLEAGDQIITTGGGKGGGLARQLGVEASRGNWIAFLDDDDEWHPQKLESQLQLAACKDGDAGPAVISCRVHMRRNGTPKVGVAPRKTYTCETPIEDYLFRRRSPSPQRASLYTSTLLAKKEIVEQVRWKSDLRRHQDWDWLLQVQRKCPAALVQAPEALVTIWLDTPNSISSGNNWAASLGWYDSVAEKWAGETRSDFLAAQPLRYAIQARSARGVWNVLRAIVRTRRVPSPAALSVGLAGLIPRRLLTHMMITGSTWARRSPASE